MQMLALCYPTLAVSAIYCIWHAYFRHQLRRDRMLRERVTFMLWSMVDAALDGGRQSGSSLGRPHWLAEALPSCTCRSLRVRPWGRGNPS